MKLLWIAMWIGIINIMTAMGLSTSWVVGLGVAGIMIQFIVTIIDKLTN